MTSCRHDVRSGPASAQQPMPAAGQPPGSPEHQSVRTASGRAGGMHIATGHDGTWATVRVSGVLTEAGTGRLAAMVLPDGELATVHLADVGSVGAGLLRVLRIARTRSQGRLTVTADRPEARFPLALVGLGDMAWPGRHDRGGGTSQVPPAHRHQSAARPRASTPSRAHHGSGDAQGEVGRDAPFRA